MASLKLPTYIDNGHGQVMNQFVGLKRKVLIFHRNFSKKNEFDRGINIFK